MNFPSKLVEEAVNQIAMLPGIGKKTALRLVLFMLKQDENKVLDLSSALVNLRTKVKYCKKCHNIADEELCGICQNKSRDAQTLCLVENISDVMAIENTSSFNGLYHVLGGVISPIEGIGPSELTIDHLLERVQKEDIKEVIFALNSSMEADTTTFYVTKKLQPLSVKVSIIARGVPIGGELEYTDEVTLGRSIMDRVTYKK